MSEAFFLPDGDRFVATELTRGPWDAGAQHAGPPAGLLGRAVERFGTRDDVQVVRVSFEILRRVPIAPLEITTTLLRGGRSVEVVGASLSDDGTEVMRATAVRIRTVEAPPDGEAGGMPPGVGRGGVGEPEAPAGPEHGEPLRFFPTGYIGYGTAIEWRFVEGALLMVIEATTMPARPRVLIYARLSRNKAGLSQSVEFQISECTEFAQSQGWEIVGTFSDDDISASKYSTKPRPGYNGLIAGLHDGQGDVVLVTETSRLYRRLEELIDVILLARSTPLRKDLDDR